MKFITLFHLAVGATAASSGGRRLNARQATPQLPTEPGTAPHCNSWWNNEGFLPCDNLVGIFGLDMADFLRWNPTITPDCGNFKTGFSYCVGVSEEVPAATSTTIKSTGPTNAPSVTTTTTKPTTTAPSNGIETPTPVQLGMIANCNKFHLVKTTTTCASIQNYFSISFSDFLEWNPAIGQNCESLWAGTYACVGVVGGSSSPTTTAAGNGIATPTPIQSGMVNNCNKFHLVKTTTTCDSIQNYYSISFSDFLKWNPAIGKNCENLWSGTNACVGVVGGSSPPTTTVAGNGITTPTPIQTGMVKNCNKFHLVKTTTTCASIQDYFSISFNDFLKWNPAIGKNCESLWSGTYACVGVGGGSASPTTTIGNGITTPTPIQSGMTKNCNKFHLVKTTTTCASIQNYYAITWANLLSWNPAVGKNCESLWANTYACVGVK